MDDNQSEWFNVDRIKANVNFKVKLIFLNLFVLSLTIVSAQDLNYHKFAVDGNSFFIIY